MADIGFIGTGIMGGHMCRNLAQAGHTVTAWNRTRAKVEALAEAGVVPAATARVAATGRQALFLMLSDGPACTAVLADGVAAALAPEGVVVIMSSVDLASARLHAQACAAVGRGCVDAPVSGGERGARDGTLSIMAGGTAPHYAAVAGLLEALGTPVHIGPSGSGQLTKLANQVVVAMTITAVAEAFTLAQAGGAELREVRAALRGGFAGSVVMEQHAQRMIDADYAPGGPAKHQLKDLRNALAAASELGVHLPQLEHVTRVFDGFVNDGGGADLDHSAVFTHVRGQAGK